MGYVFEGNLCEDFFVGVLTYFVGGHFVRGRFVLIPMIVTYLYRSTLCLYNTFEIYYFKQHLRVASRCFFTYLFS